MGTKESRQGALAKREVREGEAVRNFDRQMRQAVLLLARMNTNETPELRDLGSETMRQEQPACAAIHTNRALLRRFWSVRRERWLPNRRSTVGRPQ